MTVGKYQALIFIIKLFTSLEEEKTMQSQNTTVHEMQVSNLVKMFQVAFTGIVCVEMCIEQCVHAMCSENKTALNANWVSTSRITQIPCTLDF